MGAIKRLLKRILYLSPVKRVMESTPLGGRIYPGWDRTHPFDRLYGVDTSGYMAENHIHDDAALKGQVNPYVGSQPSAVRHAIAALPDPASYLFIDLGCGKGRVPIVASEYGFRGIRGIELSHELAQTAARNAAHIAARHPERPRIAIEQGDAVRLPYPEGRLALFIYHAFEAGLMAQLITRLERELAGEREHLFVIYYNPFYGHLWDASPAFVRFHAETMHHDAAELGYGPPDRDDAVVIWQSRRNALPVTQSAAHRPIVITKTLLRAELKP